MSEARALDGRAADVATGDRGRRDDSPLIERVPRVLLLAGFGVALVVGWHLVHTFSVLPQIIFPSPGATGDELVRISGELVRGGYLAENYWTTALASALGFLAAAVTGILLGIVVGETTFGERVVMPYLVVFNTMPKVAFAPVIVAWLGFGINSKILLAAFLASFPLLVDTAAGMRAASKEELMLFRVMEASRWQTLVKLKLPVALPHIFAGLKTASVFTVVGVVFGEYIGGGTGMGEVIRLGTAQLRMDTVFASIFVLSLLGLALYAAVILVERKVVFWKSTSVSGERHD